MNRFEHLTPDDFDILLSGGDHPAAWAHMRTCSQCRATWEEILTAHRALKDAPQVKAPPHFFDRVMAAIEASQHASTPSLPPWVYFGIALAAILVGWTGLWLFSWGYFVFRPTSSLVLNAPAFIAWINALVGGWGRSLIVLYRILLPWVSYGVLVFMLMFGMIFAMTRYYRQRLFVHAGG